MDMLALILSIIGSINWGLVGIFKFDLVAWIFGGQTAVVSRIIYTIVGLAGLWCISLLFRRRPLRAAEDDAYPPEKLHKGRLPDRAAMARRQSVFFVLPE